MFPIRPLFKKTRKLICDVASWVNFQCISVCLVFYTVCFVLWVGVFFIMPSVDMARVVSQPVSVFWGSREVRHGTVTANRTQQNIKKTSQTFLSDIFKMNSDAQHTQTESRGSVNNSKPDNRKNLQPDAGKTNKNVTRAKEITSKLNRNESRPADQNNRKKALDRKIVIKPQRESDFVATHNGSFYLYAALYNDVVNPPKVTIVAIVEARAAAAVRSMVCVYYSGPSDLLGQTSHGKISVLPDHHQFTFRPAFIDCSLPTLPMTLNLTVSIAVTSDILGNTFSIPTGPRFPRLPVGLPAPRQFNFMVCFSPLHHEFRDVTSFVTNVELARILGAEHAVVYNNSISKQMDGVLRYYVRQGFLEVENWRGVPNPVHYQAQMAAINHCLMRNRHRSDFIVFFDTDEMIAPRLHDSWRDLLLAMQAPSVTTEDFVQVNSRVMTLTEGFVSRLLKEASPVVSLESQNSNNVTHEAAALSRNQTFGNIDAALPAGSQGSKSSGNYTAWSKSNDSRNSSMSPSESNNSNAGPSQTHNTSNSKSANYSASLQSSGRSFNNVSWPFPNSVRAVDTNWTVRRGANAGSPEAFHIGAVSFIMGVYLWHNVSGLSQEDLNFANTRRVNYLLKQHRTQTLWPLRSKTIVNPRVVKVMSIHRATSFARSGYKTLLVDRRVALVQHYRWYTPSAPSVPDVNLARFAPSLVQRMKRVFKDLEY